MTRRRLLLFALVTLGACLGLFGLGGAAEAQQPGVARRIGVLLVLLSPESKEAQAFREGLRDAGYTEGRDVVIEWRSYNGDYARVPELAADLVRRKVDVIVADTTFATQAAKRATYLKAVAPSLAIELNFVSVRTPEQLDQAFSAVSRAHAQALYVLDGPLFFTHRTTLLKLASRARVPVISGERQYVNEGGLMSYGANYADQLRRSAEYVDKILKGARPGDLPIEQPTKFELVVNLKTAKALGLTIPEPILLRADEVIR